MHKVQIKKISLLIQALMAHSTEFDHSNELSISHIRIGEKNSFPVERPRSCHRIAKIVLMDRNQNLDFFIILPAIIDLICFLPIRSDTSILLILSRTLFLIILSSFNLIRVQFILVASVNAI